MLLDEVPLLENFVDSFADGDARPDTMTTALTTAKTPRPLSAAPNASSSAHQNQLRSQSHPVLPLSGVSAAAQSSCHSSPVTNDSDVDVSSPSSSPGSTADYAKVAENVLDKSSDSYQHCSSHVQPFTAVQFDTQPANLIHSNADSEVWCNNEHSVTGLRDPERLARSGENADEAGSGLVSLQHEDDACGSVDVSQNSSARSSDMPSSYMKSAVVAASSDRTDEDAASFGNCSSQFPTVLESAEAKTVAGPTPDFNRSEPLSSGDYSALDSSSLDPGYQRASVSAGHFSAELCGSAASLTPVK